MDLPSWEINIITKKAGQYMKETHEEMISMQDEVENMKNENTKSIAETIGLGG